MDRRYPRRSPARRLPIAGAVVLVAAVAAAVVIPAAADARVDLPDKTPAELLQFAAASDVTAMTGTIEQTSDLGLPIDESVLWPEQIEEIQTKLARNLARQGNRVE